MIRTPKRPSLGAVINCAAGALQQHVLQQQMNAAQLRKSASSLSSQSDQDPADEHYDGIVFSGNPHETVPRRLLLDDRLSPLERNTWQVFRLLIHTDGVTAFPTYDQLRPYLGSSPGKSASRETIAKTLAMLRLTRWLSLGRRVRDANSGRVQGNVYILHDEPIGCAEAMEIDHDYMLLIGQCLQHANKSVRIVAERALQEVAADPYLPNAALPTRLDVIEERLQRQEWDTASAEFEIRTLQSKSLAPLSSDSELSEITPNHELKMPSSESELRQKLAEFGLVRNPNSYSTYTNTDTSVCKSFVPPQGQGSELVLPDAILRLTLDQRAQALLAINRVKTDIRQSVLNQWNHRVISGGVNNPLAYLLSCVQRAVKGEFNSQWQAPSSPASASPVAAAAQQDRRQTARAPEPPLTASTPKTPDRSEATLARGRDQMLSIRKELGFISRPDGGSP